ncbi:MAG: hypothetical protein OER85_09295 [Gammaproteobacteria bacterium]|nr:hypothetical protein [Gammaproteobacteria bacterium]
MRQIESLALAAVLIMAPSSGLMAQQQRDNIEIVKSQVKTNRQALVAENLMLSESESELFWPVYRDFHMERDLLVDRRIKILREFRDNFDGLRDAQATQMLDDYLALQEDFLKLRKQYLKKFRRVLSDKKTLRYYQIENKLDMIIEYELSQVVPLAQ